MLKKYIFCCFAAGLMAGASTSVQAQSTAAKPYFSDPALSPDASEIAFISGGDIWTVPAKGGEARLLVSHPDFESRPLYSPDGRYLAFVSTRTGGGDIYTLNIADGNLKRLTYNDGPDELSGWSKDGKWVYFSSAAKDIAAMRDVFKINSDGGTPIPVSDNRYVTEFFAAPSPDGKMLALSAHGVASQQWWRKGSSHLDQAEIWLKEEGSGTYKQLSDGNAKELWPMWSADGKQVYYVSDKSGTPNLYEKAVSDGAAQQLTTFKDGRLLWPAMAANGQVIVFERDFAIWMYDMASGKVSPVSITRRGVPASPNTELSRLSSGFRELALSSDGKKVAFTVRGDVFVTSAKEGGDAFRVTNTTAIETEPIWSGNSNNLVYTANRDGVSHLYQYNFITNAETKLTDGKTDDASPLFSPDGKKLAFVRNGQELRVMDMVTKNEILAAKGYLSRPPFSSPGSVAWSPDGKWIAYAGYGAKSFRNIYVVPAAGGEARPVSFLANTFSGGINWSKDGKYILFNTSQRTEEANVIRIDLVPQQPKFREDQFQSLFVDQLPATPTPPAVPATPITKTAEKKTTDTLFKSTPKEGTAKPVPAPLQISWEGLRQRLSVLPVGVDVEGIKISPDGNTLLITASVADQNNLFTWSLDELGSGPVLKQLTTTIASKSSPQFTADSKEVFYLEGGRIQSVSLDSRTVKPLSVSAEMMIDFGKEKSQIFQEAWQLQNKGFYDSTFHGANWDAVHATYEPLAAGATTPDELRRILSLMVGELNASHSGISGPPVQSVVGQLGLRFDGKEYEKTGKLKITEVIALGPSALAGNISVGNYLLAIDGVSVTSSTNIDALLENKLSKRVALTIGTTATDAGKKITVRPVSLATEKGLLYKQWVQQQREYVAQKSKGRLGYVHLYDMSQESLNQLYLDMDAENHSRDGVVVDIRNNNGGFVNAYALDVLSRKGYMMMTVRGLPPSPARTQLGQRALEAPTILVTNQHSLSDAEDFSEGYQALNLGKVVGEPTGGWIIYTSNITLFDGTGVRLPFIRITDHNGKDMELHPRPVDIAVSNPLGEKGKDSQLDAAVAELLKELDGAKK